MSNNTNNPAQRITRFVVHNPDEAISASYNAGLGEKNAECYALYNARLNKGRVTVERIDGSTAILKDFSVKTEKKKV
jgi:hypothetical protein